VSQGFTLDLKDERREMSLLDVGVRIGEIIQASNLCLNSKFPSAGLSLMYVALDTAASLDGRLKREGTRQRFVKWVERYILCEGHLSCSALDLYGARCGLLHTYSPRSRLSSKGQVADIWYTFHDQEADMLRDAVHECGPKQVVVLSLDSLTAAVSHGITSFISDLEEDEVMAQWAISQAKQTFQFIERIGDELKPVPTLGDLEESARRVQEKEEENE